MVWLVISLKIRTNLPCCTLNLWLCWEIWWYLTEIRHFINWIVFSTVWRQVTQDNNNNNVDAEHTQDFPNDHPVCCNVSIDLNLPNVCKLGICVIFPTKHFDWQLLCVFHCQKSQAVVAEPAGNFCARQETVKTFSGSVFVHVSFTLLNWSQPVRSVLHITNIDQRVRAFCFVVQWKQAIVWLVLNNVLVVWCLSVL